MKAKKLLCLLLAAAMLLTLCACGGKGGERGLTVVGSLEIRYKGCALVTDSVGYDALVVDFDVTNKGGASVTFAEAVAVEAKQEDVLLEQAPVADEAGEPVTAAWKKSIAPDETERVQVPLVLDNTEDYVRFTFTVPGGESAGYTVTLSSARDETAAGHDWWRGSWYGWWMVYDADGKFADLAGEYWDCCAFITDVDGEDAFEMNIVDEEFHSLKNSRLGRVLLDIDLDGGEGEYGLAVSDEDAGNHFWKGDVALNDWIIDPSAAGGENMLLIESSFTDADGDSLSYGILLCRWGKEWDDNAGDRPAHYADYFHPLMEKREPLPTTFDPFAPLPDSDKWYVGIEPQTEKVTVPQQTLKDTWRRASAIDLNAYTYEMFRDEFMGGTDAQLDWVTDTGTYMFVWTAAEDENVWLGINFEGYGQTFVSMTENGLS